MSWFGRVRIWILLVLFVVSFLAIFPQLIGTIKDVFCLFGYDIQLQGFLADCVSFCNAVGMSSWFVCLALIASVVSLLRDACAPFLPGDQMVERVVHKNTTSREWSRHTLHLTPAEEKRGFRVDAPRGLNDTIESIVYSPVLNKWLQEGMRIVVSVRGEGRLVDFVRKRLRWFTELLACRQHVVQRRRFVNEDKVSICTPFADWSYEEGKLCRFEVMRSCYYVSYLLNEMHRDDVYTVVRAEPDRLARDELEPYYQDDEGHWHLPDFDEGRSLHVGVNTIAITKDGYLCLWMQQEGADGESDNMAAPTGSGSMDWADLRQVSASRLQEIDFRSAIIGAAERELLEESIGKRSERNAIRKLLQTRIIGYYRLCARGGIPGFLCITKIPMCYDAFLAKKGKDRKPCEEVARDDRIRLKIEFSSEWEKRLIAAISDVLEHNGFADKNVMISLPLRACFIGLRDALQNNQFCDWMQGASGANKDGKVMG